jgi:putative endonuclease
MKKFNYEVGKKGEGIAREYLAQKGYKILASNFTTRFGEIDLICAKSGKLIFVEVKLKVSDAFGSPEEMITKKKIEKVQKTAQRFLLENVKIASKYPSYQIDAVCIVLTKESLVSRINHYKNLGLELA